MNEQNEELRTVIKTTWHGTDTKLLDQVVPLTGCEYYKAK